MNPPVILFIIVIIAVLIIIWWWNRRSDDRPAEETYHANPFTGTAASQPAHTPAADAHAGGGHETAMAEPLAVSEPLTEAMVAEHATPEAAELPAAADPMVIAPDLVLGDESRLTAMAVEPVKVASVAPIVAETRAPVSAPAAELAPASAPAPSAADVVAPKADISLGDEAPLAAVPAEPAIPAASVAEPVPVVLPVEPVTPVAPTPIDLTLPAEPVAAIPTPASAEPDVAAKAAAPADVKVDDLVVIEGIGPKINSVLQAAGIRTFAELAAAKPVALREILTAAKLYTADPTSWPQQAKLAAAGKWTQLKTLQEKLDGGRKA